MRAGYKNMFAAALRMMGGIENFVKLTSGSRHHTGPGKRNSYGGVKRLYPMNPEKRAWMNRGLQVGSRECRRRRPAFYAN